MGFMAIFGMKTSLPFQILVWEKCFILQLISIRYVLFGFWIKFPGVPPELALAQTEFNGVFLAFISDSVHDFLCFHNIPVLVWNAVNDSESYVRASAIHLIGSLACQSQLWTCLLQNSQISEVILNTKLSQSNSTPPPSLPLNNLARFPMFLFVGLTR